MQGIDFQSQDPGLFNYPQILHLLKVEFSRARRYRYPLSCLLVQIDRLENLRDLYGIHMKEMVLDQVVSVIRVNSRSCDFLGKTGERLMMVLPHTDGEGVRAIARRIQEKLGQLRFEVDGRGITVTASMGGATYEDHASIFFDTVIKNAETVLNQVIQSGGNGFRLFMPSAVPPTP
ncbi:MAG: GGDEF domain-containing protein [Planctomycetota bacterium]